MTKLKAQIGRPRLHERGSEVFSIRVPRGTSRLIKAGFKTMERISGARVDPAILMLEAQLRGIAGLQRQNPELVDTAVAGISHVLGVLERGTRRPGKGLASAVPKYISPT